MISLRTKTCQIETDQVTLQPQTTADMICKQQLNKTVGLVSSVLS